MSDFQINWTELLDEALNKPGMVSEAYQRFHRYSIGNQVLAMVQCHLRGIEPGPISTYKGWQKLGRQVQKGQKALYLWMPFTGKRVEVDEETGEETEERWTYFKMLPRWFVLSQTDGDEVEWPATPEWDRERALADLEISEESFTHTDGNTQGYAYGRTVSVSPIAEHPLKTLVHEIAHVELGHTDDGDEIVDGRELARNSQEVAAEAVAYLVSAALGYEEGLAESRGYILHWSSQPGDIPVAIESEENPDHLVMDEAIARRVFATANKILKAGQPKEERE